MKKEFLFFVFTKKIEELQWIQNIRQLETGVYDLEPDLKSFLKYKGPLEKIIFIEEKSIQDHNLFDNHQFKDDNSTVFVDLGGGTSVETVELLKIWIKSNKITDEKLVINTHSTYEWELIKNILGNDFNPTFFCNQSNLFIAMDEFLGKKFKKRFLFLSRNWNITRLITFIDLKRRGILENSYYSFFNIKNIYSSNYKYYKKAEIDNQVNQALSQIKDLYPDWSTDLKHYWDSEKKCIIEGMPYIIDGENLELKEDLIGRQVISNTYQDAYINSAMSLVVETHNNDEDRHFQCTEKTYKSMIYRHPFLIYGDKYQLQRTRGFGYKTFEGVFDETYDTLDSQWERIYHINTQVDKLNQLPTVEFKKIIHKSIPTTTFNYSQVMNKISYPDVDIISNNSSKKFINLFRKTIPDSWHEDDY